MPIARKAMRQPWAAATAPPTATPRTWPASPPAMKAPVSVARKCFGKTLRMTAIPTLP